MAWNGGTGIAAEYRGKGVSTRLMEEAFKVYSEAGAVVATLEAIKENERAIRLYEKFGYEITDSLFYISGTLELSYTPLTCESIRPEQLPMFSFYKENVPWQCQWQSVRSGEAQIYFDSHQNPIGYSLYKRTWDQNGILEKVFLYQLELFDEVNEETIKAIFTSISEEQNKPVNFMTINASLSNPVIPLLLDLGFEKKTEQVQMVKQIKY
ncbi:GNAT family N-acetyltransferase [Neobacillus drentensis]|uniref:GNAT family N-acetyltransferase n=1 Tax=Neobacillus drentensis TaxID=220684 RepID=UPI0035B51C44